MTWGIIGAGKAGTVLGRYLAAYGLAPVGYYSRTKAHADRAAGLTGSRAFTDLAGLAAACDLLVVATPDGVIPAMAEALAPYLGEGHILAHLSGSLSHAVLKPAGAAWQAASLHPIIAFSAVDMDLAPLEAAVFSLEGDRAACDRLRALMEAPGNRLVEISAGDKTRYHAACVMASNLVCGLYGEAARQLEACGFAPDLARAALAPLFIHNAQALADQGPAAVLTGPMERNDLSTVRAHLTALADDSRGLAVYRSLSLAVLPLLRDRDPGRDTTHLEKELRSNHANNGSDLC
ncbi:Rossmann-like and DUF2520 domain-containing protein [Peptococcus simiae]|uniref:Rossmann-like and DUF2520 domain-containing protein n=1 Tax=Peptococcus simiae TaxID=1643805 RepID=A0ABW9GYC9_9FIRM